MWMIQSWNRYVQAITSENSVEPVYWSHVPILCVQLLWINQKVIQLPLIKSSFVQQTQLEANCNIPVSLIEKREFGLPANANSNAMCQI